MKIFTNLHPPLGLRRTTCRICKERTSLGIMTKAEGSEIGHIHYEHFCKVLNRYKNIITSVTIPEHKKEIKEPKEQKDRKE